MTVIATEKQKFVLNNQTKPKQTAQPHALVKSPTHHLITMEQIELKRVSILPVLNKDCRQNDSYIYLYIA